MNDTINFWELLDKYEVVIPEIQRDYAQGRKDQEYTRKTFLNDIYKHIADEKPVTLDFVYGNIEDKRFYPLDGQQRLTTLWLIHWFISLRSGMISEDKNRLSKFSYAIRTSSADFCKALCEKEIPEDTKNIVDFIKSQTWFYSSWLQDPTISAMLRTLGGNKESKDDNIEGKFGGVNYQEYRNKVFVQNIISFKLMIIGNEKLPISDDLYIKMNARGKGLTDFENFKADLVSWIENTQNPEAQRFSESKDGKTYKQYYPSQIDNSWMDIFWNSYCHNSAFKGKIDDVYFEFFNRYVLNKMCLKEKEMSPAEFEKGKEQENHKDIKARFDKLFGTELSSTDDSLIKYEGFKPYENYFTFESLQKLDFIFDIISDEDRKLAIEESLKIDSEADEENNISGYTFIPQYKEEKVVPASQKERVYFLAISLFLENIQALDSTFDKDKFKKWMRVIRNIVENAAIDNVAAMVTCMRKVDEIAKLLKQHNNDIYETLKAYPIPGLCSSQLEKQLKEEKDKAEKILENESWSKKIEEAERYAFFNGTIRFLYMNNTKVSWDDFDTKFKRAKELFGDNTVSKNTILLFLKQFTSFNEIEKKYVFTSVGYHARNKCWKKDILCSEDSTISKKVHALLMGEAKPIKDEEYTAFLDSGLAEKTIDKKDNYRYRYNWYNYWGIHKDYSQTEGAYVSLDRKKKCEELKNLVDKGTIELPDSAFNTYHNGYYWGIRVSFKYNENQYNWYDSSKNNNREDRIYKCDKDGEESNKYIIWEKPESLIEELDSKQFNDK